MIKDLKLYRKLLILANRIQDGNFIFHSKNGNLPLNERYLQNLFYYIIESHISTEELNILLDKHVLEIKEKTNLDILKTIATEEM